MARRPALRRGRVGGGRRGANLELKPSGEARPQGQAGDLLGAAVGGPAVAGAGGRRRVVEVVERRQRRTAKDSQARQQAGKEQDAPLAQEVRLLQVIEAEVDAVDRYIALEREAVKQRQVAAEPMPYIQAWLSGLPNGCTAAVSSV